MSNYEFRRVARPDEPAANQPWPQQAPRRQVSITRLGSYTRVILLAPEDEAPGVPTQQWA